VNRQTTIAIIPARGGSKRIPRKNIKPFCGVPLLARTIGLLQSTYLFARIIVSTDDHEIADVALLAGAEVPFLRPAELADDHAGTTAVIRDTIQRIEEAGRPCETVCCVYPAAVLASSETLAECSQLAATGGYDYVLPVAPFRYPVQRGLRLTSDHTCEMLWPDNFARRSQDLEPVYHDAGQFYFGRRDSWLAELPIFGPNSRAVVVSHAIIQDIDTPEDWERAEMIFQSFCGAPPAPAIPSRSPPLNSMP
jgi:N-acylneuraminate cytidylyltransferase